MQTGTFAISKRESKCWEHVRHAPRPPGQPHMAKVSVSFLPSFDFIERIGRSVPFRRLIQLNIFRAWCPLSPRSRSRSASPAHSAKKLTKLVSIVRVHTRLVASKENKSKNALNLISISILLTKIFRDLHVKLFSSFAQPLCPSPSYAFHSRIYMFVCSTLNQS